MDAGLGVQGHLFAWVVAVVFSKYSLQRFNLANVLNPSLV